MEPGSIEQLGALLGAAGAGFVGVLAPLAWAVVKWLRKANTTQAEQISEQVRKVLVGPKDDATPKHIEDNTGVIKLALRAELEPVKREQRRQGRMLESQAQQLELLTQGYESLDERGHEMSGRLAKVEARADVEALAGRLDIPLDPPPAPMETAQSRPGVARSLAQGG